MERQELEGETPRCIFAGRLPRPPWMARSRVTAMVRRLDNAHIPNTKGEVPVHGPAVEICRLPRPLGGGSACARGRPPRAVEAARLIARASPSKGQEEVGGANRRRGRDEEPPVPKDGAASAGALGLGDVACLRALGPINNFKFDGLSLLQRAEARPLNG